MGRNFEPIHSILIIDDDRDDYDLVFEAIQEINPDISVSYINSCEEASKYRQNNFDLVLLDINMPYHDGFYWLKAIREKGYAKLPVVMYTNSLSPLHIAKAYDEGANLYFAKPETFTKLVNCLREIVHTDWSEPYRITQKYSHQGKYKMFELN